MPRREEPESRSPFARYGLVAVLALLIVGAVAAGFLLNRKLSAPVTPAVPSKPQPTIVLKSTTPDVPLTQPVAAPAQAAASVPAPSISQTPSAQSNPPGSPVVPASQKPQTASVPTRQPAIPATTARQSASMQNANPASQIDRLGALANTGNANAELLLALKYLDGDGVAVNEAEAAKWLERAAKQNLPVAAYRLGRLYEGGHGVPADPVKAAQWYEVAAKAGNRKAMHNLAIAFADGAGVQKDLVVAAQWFSRAANLGLADSQFNLAVLYERGMGVQQSLIDAYKWYAVAAQQGDAESKARVEALSTQLSAEDKTAAQKAASSFRPDAAEKSANLPPDTSMVLGG